MIDLGLLFLIVWMLKNAAVDVSCAIQGTENPRYALKRQQALAAGKAAPKQPRYGGKDWAADLLSDGLAAQTERRRAKAAKETKAKEAETKAKEGKPLDDLAEAVREPRQPVPATTVRTDEFPDARRPGFVAGEDYCRQHEMPRLQQGVWGTRGVKYCPCLPELRRESSVVHEDSTEYTVRGKTIPSRPTTPVQDESPWDEIRRVIAEDDETEARRSRVTNDERPAIYRFNSDDMRGFEPLTVTCTRDDLADKIRDYLDPGGDFDFDVEVSEDSRTAAIRNHGEDPHGTVRITRTNEPKDTRPDAVIYQFPNPKKIEKEISMAISEVTGLSTALAFAEQAAAAHASFSTGGTERYTGALAQHGVGDGCISSAREAQEASQIAAAKWAKHHEDLAAQLNVKEAYQGSPDAGNKDFLLHG